MYSFNISYLLKPGGFYLGKDKKTERKINTSNVGIRISQHNKIPSCYTAGRIKV